MRLHRLTVENWRGVQGPHTVEFDPHLTVIEGPNESGKSSLRDALLMVLMEKFNSSSKTVKALRPWETQLYPSVTLDFAMGEDRYRVQKQFLRRKEAARLQRNDRLVAEDDRVQGALDELLGPHSQWLETLWGRQGQTKLEGVPDSLKGRLAAASQATVSAGVTWLQERIEQEYDRYWTDKTGKPKSPLKDATERLKRAEEACDASARALVAANEREASLAGRVAVVEAQRVAHLQLQQSLRQAEGQLQAWDAWRQHHVAVERRDADLQTRRAWLESWRRRSAELDRLLPQVQAHAEQLAALPAAAPPSRQTIDELRTLETYWTQSLQLEVWQQLDDLGPTDARDVSRLQELERELKTIDAALRLGLMSVSLEAERALEVQVEVDGESQAASLAAGSTEAWSAAASVHLRLPGIGRVRVQTANAQAEAQLARKAGLQKELAALLKKARVRSADEAVARAQERLALEARVAGPRPDRPAWEAMRSQVAEVSDLDPLDKPARLHRVQQAIAEAETQWRAAMSAYGAAQTRREQLSQERPADRLHETWQMLRAMLEGVGWELAERWSPEVHHQAADVAVRYAAEVDRLAADRQVLAEAVPRPAGAEVSHASLEAMRQAVDASSDALNRASHEVQTIIGGLQQQGDLYAQQVRAQEAQAGAEAEHGRLYREADAIKVLAAALKTARDKLQQDIVAPLERRVAERLQELTSDRYRGVRYDRELRLEAVVPQRVATAAVQDLSFGTQEQLLLLTRLCLAEMLSEQDAPQVLILDDNLVHTDDLRMQQACELLKRTSERLQVVVFTCHPDRYRFAPAVAVRHLGA